MLQNTYLRAQTGDAKIRETIVITNEAHRFLVADQLAEVSAKNVDIILEAQGRNTAPAIAAAAFKALRDSGDSILLILPADHIILNEAAFNATTLKAVAPANAGKLVTFGVQPDHPSPEYGYIKISDSINEDTYTIEKFVEKPDIETAKNYLACEHYFWNSGIFMFKASSYLRELKEYAPEIYAQCKQAVNNGHDDLGFFFLDRDALEKSPEGSIDHLIMEKTQCGVMIPLNAAWNDAGTWNALYDIEQKDEHGNVAQGDIALINTENCYLHAQSRLLACIGLEDTLIIETPDVILAAKKDQLGQIKNLVHELALEKGETAHSHRRTYRPWGWYETLSQSKGFKVKEIMLKPKASLSLQHHEHRSEHWVVVSGTATVGYDNKTITLLAGQSTFIPPMHKHRLSNETDTPVHIIETQCGDYLEEDDIIRTEEQQ